MLSSSLINQLANLPSHLSEKLSRSHTSPSSARGGWIPLPTSPDSVLLLPDGGDDSGRGYAYRRHRRWESRFGLRGVRRRCANAILLGLVILVCMLGVVRWRGDGYRGLFGERKGAVPEDDGGVIPLGQSRMRGGGEVFWWEQFEKLGGYWNGREKIVGVSKGEWRSEQDGATVGHEEEAGQEFGLRNDTVLVDVGYSFESDRKECYIDETKKIKAPSVMAYAGMPQRFPRPLFGSAKVVGIRDDICYDRINRFGPYGYGSAEKDGGLGIGNDGDTEGKERIHPIDFSGVNWRQVQETCINKNGNHNRTAFVIRTWHGFKYTPYHIMMLRAMVSELAIATGGKYEVHFLIHVQNDGIPIWASQEVYDKVLKESLPREFAGMGTLWSVAQMKLIYPPPFLDSMVNFSGDDIYNAYRSLHFPLQYFATKHSEFDFFWHWEMDMRVTGPYFELLDKITKFADSRPRKHLWAESSKFFIPDLYHETDDRSAYNSYTEQAANLDSNPISGPQLPTSDLLSLPFDTSTAPSTPTDLIVFSPLFDPNNTLWAFHEDITGYTSTTKQRPPTRAALITASRLSRRLLLTMHHETFLNKHTMFPEMYPASIALHYGYTAVTAPLPIYLERTWNPSHANIVFNNAPIPPSSPESEAGMDHNIPNGHFHGEGGSVFGPGEHVFRGASWYSNAWFAQDLWKRWLGVEDWMGLGNEKAGGTGRLCFPMMVLHPVKNDE